MKRESKARKDAPAKSNGPRSFAALLVTAVLAAALFMGFGRAVADGLAWKAQSEAEIVAPDLEVRVPSRAKQVPDFTLKDRFGNNVSLSQFAKVDVLLVSIWSSGCPTCREEVPALTELDRRLGTLGSIALITISTDEGWDDVRGFFPRGTDLRVLFDPEQKVTKDIFGTVKYPELFVLDRQRRILARFDGARDWPTPPMLDYLRSKL
ncbi:MAG: TlpA disulfide reductase family protein [Deltaproteobacteria bacterium]|nr:TlpA disulfide reductase family protein [Deltaproteobacteria bacterium]